MKCVHLLILALSSSVAYGQRVTATDAYGDIIVESVTEDALGDPTTLILSTIPASTTARSATATGTTTARTATTAATATTTAAPNPGQVETPGQGGNAGDPTPFTYTTTDANGNYVQRVGTFEPTAPATVLPNPTTTGVVLQYSSWLALVGTNTIAASGGAAPAWNPSRGWYGAGLSIIASVAGGIWIFL